MPLPRISGFSLSVDSRQSCLLVSFNKKTCLRYLAAERDSNSSLRNIEGDIFVGENKRNHEMEGEGAE